MGKQVLIWIDCEMTGLDDVDDEIVEIAVVPTDENFELLDPNTGIDIIVKPTEKGVQRLHDNDFVYKMHQKSGLLDALESGIDIKQAEDEIIEYIKKFAPNAYSKETSGAMLSGNSVHVDWRFLNHYTPKITEYLHYRIIDVSTLKELAKMHYPEIMHDVPQKDTAHRALDDILESIEEMRYYKEHMFK